MPGAKLGIEGDRVMRRRGPIPHTYCTLANMVVPRLYPAEGRIIVSTSGTGDRLASPCLLVHFHTAPITERGPSVPVRGGF